MSRRSILLASGAIVFAAGCSILWQIHHKASPASIHNPVHLETKTMTSTIIADIDAFVAAQNKTRGQTLLGGGTLSLDYDALTGSVPAGGNSVTGVAGIASGAAGISLPTANGNTVIVDGAISTAASTSGADSYSLFVSGSGAVTLTDNNTGNSEAISGANYILFDGAATTSSGAYQSLYIIETGVGAELAAMYNAALGRVPDLPGLEFYIDQFGTAALPDMHAAAKFFMSSPEFKALYPALQTASDNGGPNDQAFITELYGQILHRTPSATEIQYYVSAIQGTLTTSTGAAIPAADRATLLEYFTQSPENQADISAANGGFLINPANGAVHLGGLSTATATALLASEAASGTVNTADFTNMPSSDAISAGGVGIVGPDYLIGNTVTGAPVVSANVPNITIDLSSEFYLGGITASGATINSAPTGGSVILLADSSLFSAAAANYGGTVNLTGNVNWIESGNTQYSVTPITIVNGWNSTDIIVGAQGNYPSRVASAASLLANTDGDVLQGSASHPISGAALEPSLGNGVFFNGQLAVNVGTVANDSVAAMVTAANAAYKVGDVSGENAFFFGQDPHGNTMVFYWRGDTANAGTIQASDITGDVELVGVQASSLTNANFHH
jgi:hypothetical protein